MLIDNDKKLPECSDLNVRYNAETDCVEIFHLGSWVTWRNVGIQVLYLYNAGDENFDVTGSWIAKGKGYSSSAFSPTTPTITKNDTSMTFALSSGSYKSGTVCTQNLIDLTNYKTLTISYSASVPYKSSTSVNLIIFSGFTGYSEWVHIENLVHSDSTGSGQQQVVNETIEINIASIYGEYYVGIFGWTSTFSGSVQCTVYELYLK